MAVAAVTVPASVAVPSVAGAAVPCSRGGACTPGSVGPGGGTVFYAATSPQWWGTWMEARPVNRGAGLPWSTLPTTSLFSGADAARQVIDHTGIGYGRANTDLIVAQSGSTGSAAAYVDALVTGGHSDWFLPSKDELSKLYDYYALHAKPTMAKAPYWSSSENGPNYAFYQLFQDGTQFTDENGLGNVVSNKQLRRMPVHRGSGFGPLQFRLVAVRAFGPVAGVQPATSDPRASGRVCTDDGPCTVGDTGPGGGIVFYDAGTHMSWGRYLEMAPVATESEGIPWKKLTVVDRQRPLYRNDANGLAKHQRVRSKSIGTGYANTKQIVRNYGPGNYAAWKTWELVYGGKSDWFLPSEDELNEAHRFLFTAVPSINDIRRSFYWSSSEYNYDTAWTVNMKDGQQFDREKWKVPDPAAGVKAIRTRAVRAFG